MWKIALVDDDFQVLDGLRSIIPWEELDAEFAGDAIDGEEGLKLIEEVNPDIVITDIYMPMMNGIEMIERLRARKFPDASSFLADTTTSNSPVQRSVWASKII
ncbi:response regulator [Cohnella cellulosilytica]|uniref:response regulator n=1 Tax=Cohnella cellulosilytica TaxID=986710 RepID=UPI0036224A7E